MKKLLPTPGIQILIVSRTIIPRGSSSIMAGLEGASVSIVKTSGGIEGAGAGGGLGLNAPGAGMLEYTRLLFRMLF